MPTEIVVPPEVCRKDNRWIRETPLTPEQLKKFREQMVALNAEHFGGSTDQRYTCDGCGIADRCTLAFDGYNTNGDCLYEK